MTRKAISIRQTQSFVKEQNSVAHLIIEELNRSTVEPYRLKLNKIIFNCGKLGQFGSAIIYRVTIRRRSCCFCFCVYDSFWKNFPNRRYRKISPESYTILFFNIPMIEVLFHTCGSVPLFRFSKLQSKEEQSVDGNTLLSLYNLLADIDLKVNVKYRRCRNERERYSCSSCSDGNRSFG